MDSVVSKGAELLTPEKAKWAEQNEAQPEEEHHLLNSLAERRLLTIAQTFQHQFFNLHPQRRPLLLSPLNECGVKKFVCTTLRPSPPLLPELLSWEGCASFVANSLLLEPLDPPEELPRSLASPSSVLQRRSASCLEFAVVLCSLLLGADYNAYCVSGYAVRDICERGRRLQECPLVDTEMRSEVPEQEEPETKYPSKSQRELRSRYLSREQRKTQEAEATLVKSQTLQEEAQHQEPADPLRGLRVHCWVLVLSGSRSVQEDFFINPLTGTRHSTQSENFLGIESVWNHLNYFVNMQDCGKGCKNLLFDLDNPCWWEPLLFGAISTKQLNLNVRKKTERRTKRSGEEQQEEQEEEQLEAEQFRGLDLPVSWVSSVSVTKSELSVSQHRNNPLQDRLTDVTEQRTSEHRGAGRHVHLMSYRCGSSSRGWEREAAFGRARVDDLVNRVMTSEDMVETFEGRSDFLHQRRVVFSRRVRFPERSDGTTDLWNQPVQRVVERFHRNASKPASEDVMERVFVVPERRIELTFHCGERQLIPSTRTFTKPRESTEHRKAQIFSRDLVSGFQVDGCVQPPQTHTLHKMLQCLMKEEEEVLKEISLSLAEMRELESCRQQKEQQLQLQTTRPHTHQTQLQECDAAEEPRRPGAKGSDVLVPLLLRLGGGGGALNPDGARRLYHHCLSEFKEQMVQQAELLQERLHQVRLELQEKQEWFLKNRTSLSVQQLDGFQDDVSQKTLQLRATQRRLSMLEEESSEKLKALDQKLRLDSRLSAHFLG